jgi:Rps23 Pro-64 3,4-dihydroxylase Tpa1-like proline 4-hydroxylase
LSRRRILFEQVLIKTMTKNALPSKKEFVELISQSLLARAADLKARFEASASAVGVRHVAIDDLLPHDVATAIAAAFPDGRQMRLMDSFREKKFTSKAYDRFEPVLGDVTFAFQDPRVVEIVEGITGIAEQVPDSLLYAGGLSAMALGHFLSPHIDNSHDSSRQYYRTLNLLYYVTPDWDEPNGGNLQLWDRKVSKNVTIHSRFNRLVLMETTPTSWHSVNEVQVDGLRKCVSNYYFSRRSPTGQEYFNITAFSAPPSQPALRLWSRVDANLRQLLRKVKPAGLGKVDVYDGPPR